jgi:hypothetical protein
MLQMKKLIAIVLLFGAVYCNAQNKVQRAQAFFTVSIPGIQLTDENGNRINPEPIVERFIYLECKFSCKPKIDSVLYNGIWFAPSVADKEEIVSNIGINKNNGVPVLLKPKKGNHIWRIDLVQPGSKILQHESVKKILIKGKLDKTKFNYTIYTETELSTPDRY